MLLCTYRILPFIFMCLASCIRSFEVLLIFLCNFFIFILLILWLLFSTDFFFIIKSLRNLLFSQLGASLIFQHLLCFRTSFAFSLNISSLSNCQDLKNSFPLRYQILPNDFPSLLMTSVLLYLFTILLFPKNHVSDNFILIHVQSIGSTNSFDHLVNHIIR